MSDIDTTLEPALISRRTTSWHTPGLKYATISGSVILEKGQAVYVSHVGDNGQTVVSVPTEAGLKYAAVLTSDLLFISDHFLFWYVRRSQQAGNWQVARTVHGQTQVLSWTCFNETELDVTTQYIGFDSFDEASKMAANLNRIVVEAVPA